jgi:glycerophosphoryl diester phosphodiesterase
MTKKNCDKAHKNGKSFGAWKLDKKSEIMEAIRIGVDAYFTCHPAKAIDLEERYREEQN